MPELDIDWRWVVGTALAVCGACAAAYGAVIKRRESRADIRVGWSQLTRPSRDGSVSPDTLIVRVENHGYKEMCFSPSWCSAELKGDPSRLVVSDSNCPLPILKAGAAVEVAYPLDLIRGWLSEGAALPEEEFRIAAVDNSGRESYTSWRRVKTVMFFHEGVFSWHRPHAVHTSEHR